MEISIKRFDELEEQARSDVPAIVGVSRAELAELLAVYRAMHQLGEQLLVRGSVVLKTPRGKRGRFADMKEYVELIATPAAAEVEPYKGGPLSPEQLYELELSSGSPVEFLHIRPAVVAEFVRVYRLVVRE